LTAALVWVWVHAAPLLTRPVFTWHGQTQTAASFEPLSHEGYFLLIIAAGACAVRAAIYQAVPACRIPPSGFAVVHAAIRNRLDQSAKRPKWLRVARVASQMTFMLSGLCRSWADAAILAGVLALCHGTRLYGLLSLSRPLALLASVPRALRAGICVLALFLMAWVLAASGAEGSWPMLVMVAFSLLVSGALLGQHETWRRQ
jgi:hypothetical protein